jgi:predicted RNase H-like HicB family nuclease
LRVKLIKIINLSSGLNFGEYYRMYRYKLHISKEKEGGYTVSVPALPDCITYGEDWDEAVSMAKEAISLYIEELQERGEAIPEDSNTTEYSLIVEGE